MAAEKRIADRRIFGRDHAGREVLVAAPGQPIPEGFEPTEDQATPARKTKPTTAAGATTTDPPPAPVDPAAGLKALGRDDLNALAQKVGVENAADLGDNGEVIQAIGALETLTLEGVNREDLNALAQFTGIADPAQLQNKQAVVDAITAAKGK